MTAHEDMTDKMIRLLCLNLRFGPAEDGPNNWDRRKACYPVLIASLGFTPEIRI